MRVVIGMPSARLLGGAERLLLTLAQRSGHVGLDLHVVLLQPGPLERHLTDAGVRTSLVEGGRFRHVGRGLRAVRRVARIVRAERPDVVLSWLPRAHLYLAPGAILARTPARLAWWQHHNGEGEEALVQLATLLPAAGIVCTSQAAADRQALVRPRRPLLVCHPGVPEPPAVEPGAVAGLRARLGLPPDAILIGLVGRLVRWKGQDRFLEALSLLRSRAHNVSGLIVGGDDDGLAPGYAHELRRRAEDLRVPCCFTGHVADPSGHLAAMDVLVNASEREPFGMTLAEAMALGVPVLAVDSGGPSEIVEPEVSGLLVPDGDPATLAEGLERLVADPVLRARLSAGGRARYAERFTAESFGQRAARALRSLAEPAGPG